MLRSMYSGISGMKNFQTKLDVIGNNIANVNTSGYKKGRVTFQDMMSQTLGRAEAPLVDANNDNIRGGINPRQVGLGSQVGSIDTIQTQGNRQTTNRSLDLALEGDGMFAIENQDGSYSFTRSGNFYLDKDGTIVDSNGRYLVGTSSDTNDTDGRLEIPTDAQSFSILSDGTVSYVAADNTVNTDQKVQIALFSNPGGLEKSGSNTFRYTENAGEAKDALTDLITPGEDGAGTLVSGALEMSNVDLAEEFTEMITAQRGFQANTRIITTSDEILQELVNLKR